MKTKTIALLAAGFFGLAVRAEDVRERIEFDGPFDLKCVQKMSFAFDCDDVSRAYRTFLYVKSGEGCYVIPFALRQNGRNEVVVDRNDCVREEGKVAGWGKVSKAIVSFWHDREKSPKWSVSGFTFAKTPYDAVVVTADRCIHQYPLTLSTVGLGALLIGANELDDEVLAPAKLVVPIGGKTPYPKTANEAIARFKKNGGTALSYEDRMTASIDPLKLAELVERRQPALAGKLAAHRHFSEQARAENAKAAAAFSAFMTAGGEGEIRAIDCHTAYGPERVADLAKWENWDANCAFLKKLGFNALCVNVCRGGIAFYKSDVLPMSPEVAEKGDCLDLIQRACDKHGMKFIAWRVCFRSRKGMKTPEFEKWIAEGRGAVSFDGKLDDEWLCPVNPTNRKLEIEALVELAKRRPWAISLDYIRYPSEDWCACEHCRRLFEKHVGRAIEGWPKAVKGDPALLQKWREFRQASISSLVKAVSKRVREEAPGVKIRASVFRYPQGDARSVAQDWSRWCQEGWVDVIAPMDGADNKETIAQLVKIQREAAGGALLTPSCYPSTWKDPMLGIRDLMDQVRTIREAKVAGFGVFTFDGKTINMLDPEGLQRR